MLLCLTCSDGELCCEQRGLTGEDLDRQCEITGGGAARVVEVGTVPGSTGPWQRAAAPSPPPPPPLEQSGQRGRGSGGRKNEAGSLRFLKEPIDVELFLFWRTLNRASMSESLSPRTRRIWLPHCSTRVLDGSSSWWWWWWWRSVCFIDDMVAVVGCTCRRKTSTGEASGPPPLLPPPPSLRVPLLLLL